MKTNPVIEGIGQAGSAATTYPEYCLLGIDWWPMCMTKGEWSGWMQAGGAVLAIAATWYITSAQQRAQRDKELRLAALDASTMLEEILSVRSSFVGVKGALDMMLRLPDKVFAPSILGLSATASSINLRPLRDQDRLVHVGAEYLGRSASILQQISKLKSDAEEARFLFEHVRDDGFEKLKSILKEVEIAEQNCTDAARMLQAFAASQGITLSVSE